MTVKRQSEPIEDERASKVARGGGASSVPSPGAGGEVFHPQLLRMYYALVRRRTVSSRAARLFPYRPMYRWLSYGQDPYKGDPHVVRDFFSRREFSFTIENDVYIRYLSFKDEAEMRREIQSKQPHKIDIGAVYTAPPSKHNTIKKEAFYPVERELVFDVDLTDYDDVRTCCSGANICERCWYFMTIAIKVVDFGLREDFGFKHLLWVYSGRRGVHCWVCDREARVLPNGARTAIVEYFSVVTGDLSKRVPVDITSPLHPALQRTFRELETMFVNHVLPDEGQGLLGDNDPSQWEKVLRFVPEVEGATSGRLNEREKSLARRRWKKRVEFLLIVAGADTHARLRDYWREEGTTPERRWAQLKSAVAKSKQVRGARLQVQDSLDKCIPTIVFTFTYPRIDVNVTKGMNHLLKSPFCVHPKTGRVCVPIDPRDCDSFDPAAVPTVADLCEDLDLAAESKDETAMADDDGDAGRRQLSTSPRLAPYLRDFEQFLRPLERSIAAAMHKQAAAAAASSEIM